MITKPTVFVLGAGASYNFGFPLGKNLVDIILENFNPENTQNAIELFEGLGFSKDEILSFREELKFSATFSIDSFLEQREGEERYLGKLAIANALIPFENKEPLFYDNSWYKTLINAIQPTFDDFERNRIAFITFNYDRSLEHFLMTTLQNRFKKSEKEVAEKLKIIPIIHLYGKLGLLPWESTKQGEYTREYNSTILPHHLRKSSSSLKIIYDKVEQENPEFKEARKILGNARKIYFLGFGYHKDNLDRLRIRAIIQNSTSTFTSTAAAISKIVEGTSYKLPQDLKDNIPKLYKIKLPNHELDINNFFEQRIRLE